MKIENIRYLVETSKCRSINHASQQLFMNQQQLSHLIRSQEEELGVQIFVRSPKGIALTPAGERIIVKLQQMLDLYDSIQRRDRHHHETTGQLQIMAEANLWTSYSRLYSAFAESYPNVTLRIRKMATESIIAALGNKEGVGLVTTIAVDGEYDITIPHELSFVPISRDRVFVYGAAGNPQCENRRSISLATLKDLPLINYKPYIGAPSLTERIFRDLGEPTIAYEVDDVRVFEKLVQDTECLFIAFHRPTYLPESMRMMLHEIPLRDEVIMETGVVKHRDDTSLSDDFFRFYLDFYNKLYDETGRA